MIAELSFDDFKFRNRISEDDWQKADIEWNLLRSIGVDHEQQTKQLEMYASMLAGFVQQYQVVHSVRWRVKDPEHLMVKILRKRIEGAEKYNDIDVENYWSKITDLVGVRALHLFKNDALFIDSDVRQNLDIIDLEMPILYKRKGDEVSEELYPSDKFEHKDHLSGYRSIHYIVKAQPQKRIIYTELQVRTIFEEGWSEIDHRVRYPNFDSDEMVDVFLNIFNRLAGQADEMGSFVQELAKVIAEKNKEVAVARDEKRQSLDAMDKLVSSLEDKSQEHNKAQETIQKLKSELSKMKRFSASEVSGLVDWAGQSETARLVAQLGETVRQGGFGISGSNAGRLRAISDMHGSWGDIDRAISKIGPLHGRVKINSQAENSSLKNDAEKDPFEC